MRKRWKFTSRRWPKGHDQKEQCNCFMCCSERLIQSALSAGYDYEEMADMFGQVIIKVAEENNAALIYEGSHRETKTIH